MTIKGRPNVRGTKPLMMKCANCDKKYKRILIGQKLCLDCMKRRNKE